MAWPGAWLVAWIVVCFALVLGWDLTCKLTRGWSWELTRCLTEDCLIKLDFGHCLTLVLGLSYALLRLGLGLAQA